MDFLDSLDLHTTDKKSNRVRSWYLYEQYKSLEKNQLDAANKLKNKSYQGRILHRELSERRARRQFSKESNLTHSESHIERSIKNDPTRTPYSVSSDSIFESVCEQEDVVSSEGPDDDALSKRSYTSKFYDFKSSDLKREYSESCGSNNSVIEKTEVPENFADDIKEELEFVKKNIAEIINLQIETENESIERYAEICHTDRSCDSENSISIDNNSNLTTVDKYAPKDDNGFFTLWSKLVAFSYNIMQMNRGNCYYDYSTQFLTAVLAFDVFRRGINRMCHILQPFVSPIKFACEESDESDERCLEENLQNYKSNSKKSCNIYKHRSQYRKCKFNQKYRSFARKYHSEDGPCCKHSLHNRMMKLRGTSEPWRSEVKFSGGQTSRGKQSWREFSDTFQRNKCTDTCRCHQLKKAINPIIKLSQYIDTILHEIDD